MSMLEHAGVSEQGPVRPNNEDYIGHRQPEEPEVRQQRGSMFVVADGVGGSLAGEVASMEATRMLIDLYYKSPRQPVRALQQAFAQANLHVYDLSGSRPEYRRMQTTLSALALVGDQAHIGHIGDSRIYRIRDTEVEQLTRDHSEVGELVRMQLLTAEEARHHPRRNIITRSIGGELMLQAEFRIEPVELGDIFVLCTDGLWEPVSESEMAQITGSHPAAEACRLLVELAVERGTQDNLSIQVVKVLGWEEGAVPRAAPKQGFWQRAFGWPKKQG